MATRRPHIVVEDWWLVLTRKLVAEYKPGLVALGRELAELVGRRAPFSHTALSLFANKKAGAAQDLQEALCKKFRIPPPIFFPRSFGEALAMLAVKEAHDSPEPRSAEQSASVHELERRRLSTATDDSKTMTAGEAASVQQVQGRARSKR